MKDRPSSQATAKAIGLPLYDLWWKEEGTQRYVELASIQLKPHVLKATETTAVADSWQPRHPIAYLPSLLAILGPLIIPVYKAALTGKRIVS